MHLHPTGDALVITGDEMYAVPRRYLGYALSCLCVPYCGVCYAAYTLPAEPRMLALYPRYFGEYLRRSPLHAGVRFFCTSVQLEDAIKYAVMIHRPPAAGKRLIIAPVK